MRSGAAARRVAVGQDTGEAPLRDGADDRSSRADARDREPAGSLAVVAGDAIAPPPRPEPAPWWSPAAETRRASRPGGDRAPFGFVPLAVVAVAFLTLPLIGLLVRAPWRSLPGDLTAPGVLTALRLSLICSVGALCLSLLFGVPLAWVLARVAFPGRAWCAPSCCCRWSCRRSSAASRCCSRSARNGLVGQWLDELVRHHAAVLDRRRDARRDVRRHAVPRHHRRGRPPRHRPALRGRRGDPRRRPVDGRSAGSRCR